ncbi:MAG: hypothetical protein ACKOI2_08550 [Actinomycetota bacterium]
MSLPSRSSRLSRTVPKCLVALSLISVGLTFASPNVTAGGGTALNWSPGRGQVCVSAFGGEVLLTSALAPNLDEIDVDPWANPIAPTGTVTSGPPLVLDFSVPDAFFDSERFGADPDSVMGFYLVSFEFVDDCDSRQPIPFTPCFVTTTGPDPWILDLGDLHLLFFFYADQPGFGSSSQPSVLEVSDGSNGCSGEEPDGGPDGPGDPQPFELLDLIDEFDLDFEYQLGFRPDFDFDIDHYRRMAEAQEAALPDTL